MELKTPRRAVAAARHNWPFNGWGSKRGCPRIRPHGIQGLRGADGMAQVPNPSANSWEGRGIGYFRPTGAPGWPAGGSSLDYQVGRF